MAKNQTGNLIKSVDFGSDSHGNVNCSSHIGFLIGQDGEART